MTELLAPAGDEQSAYAALNAGADAVYLGLTRFSARDSAENFSLSALERVARFAHIRGAKVYVALNTLVKEEETGAFFHAAREAYNAGADAILLQDIFLGRALKDAYPELTLHLSTQAGCCNVHGAEVAKEYGFSRAVLARETPAEDIAAISAVIETEAFIQGALCTCFSGQCYLSSFAGGNSGNRGRCKQPCRKKYAVDRAGFEESAYALSLSDLSVGKDVTTLLSAGVTSLKIEGRMRSPAYAAAAVKYYRALLAGREASGEFSDLARAYNRGGYTRGIGFGQDKSLLSRAVQGHIGERAGFLSRRNGKFFCESRFAAQKGDAFKILRGGKEVGGAAFAGSGTGGFFVVSSEKLCEGDEVRVTTDTAANARALAPAAGRRAEVFVRLNAGQPAFASCEGFSLTGVACEAAKNAPLKDSDVAANFAKTDGLPLAPDVRVETDGVFLPKSALNAFRRAFYEGLAAHLAPARAPLAEKEIPMPAVGRSEGGMTAVIVAEGTPLPKADIVVWKPRDYANLTPPAGVWLYLPPLFTAADEKLVAPRLSEFAGVFCEGTYGIALARKYGVKLFAGAGWNITNPFAAVGAGRVTEYFTLSKEISAREQERLAADNAFYLAGGDLKVMDLCYCPFSRTCASCDRRGRYTLTDEAGRQFPLRRYRAAEGCRFELFNCVPLAAGGGRASALLDCSLGDVRAAADARHPEKYYTNATKGHSVRSMQ